MISLAFFRSWFQNNLSEDQVGCEFGRAVIHLFFSLEFFVSLSLLTLRYNFMICVSLRTWFRNDLNQGWLAVSLALWLSIYSLD